MEKKSTQKRRSCFECKKQISMKQGAWVLLGTYNRPAKPDHEAYFHFPCFVDYWNARVEEKARGLNANLLNVQTLINDPQIKALANSIIKDMKLSHSQNQNAKSSSSKGKKRHTTKKSDNDIKKRKIAAREN